MIKYFGFEPMIVSDGEPLEITIIIPITFNESEPDYCPCCGRDYE